MERVETLVIGAGQAGLATSYHLTRLGREHLVLDAGQVGDTWRTRRWDSFTLVTPNWTVKLPGLDPLPDPDGFLPRSGVVEMLSGYAAAFGAPIRSNVAATSLDPAPEGKPERYHVTTDNGSIAARNVVIATGWFRLPRTPAWAAEIDPSILQLNATEYRNAGPLPPGGVLVVGSAQTGGQIVEDLQLAGRDVWLSTGKVGRVPRRYRGRDAFHWLEALGAFGWTEQQLPDPRGRFGPNPHVSGARGGHTINLHRFARDGVHLLGHVTGTDGTTMAIGGDMHENVGRADFIAGEFRKDVDKLVSERGLDAPPADHSDPRNTDEHDGQEAFDQPLIETLDLAAEGIGTIIWSVGYLPDHSWIHLPVFDEAGHPKHVGGITDQHGVAFVGLRYQRWLKSDLFYGVGDDAQHVVERLVGIDDAAAATLPA